MIIYYKIKYKMNGEQFKFLITTKYKIDTITWAPEVCLYRFPETEQYNVNDPYQLAMMTLHYNELPFKNRMTGVIVDEWINKEYFKPILPQMILALEELHQLPSTSAYYLQLEDWQVNLLNLLKKF